MRGTSTEYVVELQDADRTMIGTVGGKAAHLGELSRAVGLHVPWGYCVTTDACRRFMTGIPSLDDRLVRLSGLEPGDSEAIRRLSAEIRCSIEEAAVPADLAAAITGPLGQRDEPEAYAVRSSATIEDTPTASSAGLQDTFLNVIGLTEILDRVRRCWASLFTERAVAYRRRNGTETRDLAMAVIVQRMVAPEAAGVMFTADPVTGNRRIVALEAVLGLGESLVSGRASSDVFKVRDHQVVEATVVRKDHALRPSPTGGTEESAVEPERGEQPTLTEAQVLRLVYLGRRIEAHLGTPQDIEWCLVDDDFHIVQSRPITTLFPVPEAGDRENHVYVSVGHQQMMTDPMKPLGLSVWQLTAPRPMAVAGGRLFVDVTDALASPDSRPGVLRMLGRSDPLIGDALQSVVEREDFLPPTPDATSDGKPPWLAPGEGHAELRTDAGIVEDLIASGQAMITSLERDIQTRSGAALIEFILADLEERRRNVFDPRSLQAVMAGIEAAWWLNDHMREWLGETNAADTLTRSVPHNVTSEMGLALLEIADTARPRPDLVAFLRRVEEQGCDDETFLEVLASLPGGEQARDAIQAFLDSYGMRCVGEIDITRPRWSERPTALVPAMLTNVKAFAPGAAKRRFEQGLQQAREKERELLERLQDLPDGEAKAAETKRMIDRVRTFAGYREYPKYMMVSRYFIYKRALLAEAARLVQAGVLQEEEDMFFLTLAELHETARTRVVDEELIRERKEAFASYQALTPPRVLTSDGEALTGAYRRADLPAGALPGLAVSAGTVYGRARVIADIAQADLEPGDILVTAYTDPSWTPVFPVLTGLVTEVGGLMTHGAVIAREYGLPAVVGVDHATQLIADGQRIRLHGSDGYVEPLAEPGTAPDGTQPIGPALAPKVPSLTPPGPLTLDDKKGPQCAKSS